MTLLACKTVPVTTCMYIHMYVYTCTCTLYFNIQYLTKTKATHMKCELKHPC